MDNKQLRVLFSSDDNYAQHLGAAVYSLAAHNGAFEEIQIYVIDNDISAENRKKLETVSNQFPNSKIMWLPFAAWKAKLNLNMAWNISLSAYARLFLAEILPNDVDQILYMDCDMIVCDSLMTLWNVDLQGKILGAVQDDIGDSTKLAVGLSPQEPYFNSGLLLVNLAEWRAQNIGEACLDFINKHEGNVIHHDQGVLNGVLKDKWYRLPVECNLMTIHYVFNLDQINRYYEDHAVFYTAAELKHAKQNPVVLHYTPSFTPRPWVRGCAHPHARKYWDALQNTPWTGATPEADHDKWYVKLINWRYRNLPF